MHIFLFAHAYIWTTSTKNTMEKFPQIFLSVSKPGNNSWTWGKDSSDLVVLFLHISPADELDELAV